MTHPTSFMRRKRSRTLTLTTAMATAGLSLSACDQPWDSGSHKPVEAAVYASLDQCKASGETPAAECDKAFAAAQADDAKHSPRYDARDTCEDVYGAGNCVPRGYNNGGGSWFGPLLTGFVVGRMLDGGGRQYYRGSALYRQDDRYGNGGYVTPWGGHVGRDYSTGRTVVERSGIDPSPAVRQAPAHIQSRTSAISRGGFGGRMSGAHFGG